MRRRKDLSYVDGSKLIQIEKILLDKYGVGSYYASAADIRLAAAECDDPLAQIERLNEIRRRAGCRAIAVRL